MRTPRLFLALAVLVSALAVTITGCGGGSSSLPTPTLTFAAISTQTYGVAPFTVSATSASTGAVTYSVVTGPATISGNTVTITGAGTVVLGASQAATSSYTSAVASTSFVVTPAVPAITFIIPNQTFGSAPIALNATSNSTGAITYSIDSGPATISGSLLSTTGTGAVTVIASEGIDANYTAAQVHTTFNVTAATPTLSFVPIPTQIATNAPFPVTATSASTGAITYSITSPGSPAILSGNMLTLTGGSGTVYLSASQAATANYAAATATTSFSVVATGSTAGTSFNGRVTANGLSVIGATVQLYDVGTSGNGSRANTRLAAALTTDANGNFTVPSSFSCTSASTSLFLLSKGGKAGSAGTTNSSLWLATALPPCGSLSSTQTFAVNELTTVALTEALAQFMTVGGNVGAAGSNALGVTNAILTAQSLANIFTGVSPGASVPANVTVSSAKLNTLADALSPCAVSGTSCSPLFAAATAGATVPTNTLDAALLIARNPSSNVATLFSLATNTAFAPVLTAAPPDWMMYITISGGGLSAPTALALDSFGNLWSASYNNALSAFSPVGASLFGTAGIYGSAIHESFGLAIDASNNVWVENDETPGSPRNGGSIAKVDHNTGGPLFPGSVGFTDGIYFPTGISVDVSGDIWIANYGNSTYALYTNAGSRVSTNCNVNGCGYGAMEFPVAVAADSYHVAWFANQSATTVTRVTHDNSVVTAITCCSGASGVAIDEQNNVWVANYFGDSISELSSGGTVISNGYRGGGIYHPQGIAIDGSGTVWTANYRGGSLTVLSGATSTTPGTALSPSTGYGSDAGLIEPYGVALDASGNAWVSSYAPNTVVEFVGVATPVKMPLVGPVQIP